MTMPFGNTSALERRATELGINLQTASNDVRLNLYREILIQLETFLDTGDISKLTESSITIIRNDVILTIKGIQSIQTDQNMFVLALEELRSARDKLTIAGEIVVTSNLKSSHELFNALRSCRKNLSTAISQLQMTKGLAGDSTTDTPPPEEKITDDENLYQTLLTMVSGDKELVERLISREIDRNSAHSRSELISQAMRRLTRDNMLVGDPTTDAPPPDVKKKNKKGEK